MGDIAFSGSTQGVDWATVRAALVTGGFDNGRTPEEYRRSHERSHAVVLGWVGDELVANGRVLSDGVCNAYLVDVWTAPAHRRRGVGREVVRRLLETVPGQHVGLFTDDMQDFYRTLGFAVQPDGMSLVVGSWLNR